MKVKLKKKCKPSDQSTASESKRRANLASFKELPPLTRLQAFIDVYKRTEDAHGFPGKVKVLREYYERIWEKSLPHDQPVEMIRTKIAYELLRQDYVKAGFKIPEKVSKNIAASAAFNIEGISPDLRQTIKILVKHQSTGEDTMEKKTKEKKEGKTESAFKVTVAPFYLEIFEKQESRKLTDEQIAAAIKKETGTEPSLKSVASYRCLYNQGKVAGQDRKPADKIKAFRKQSEATKAKEPAKKKLVLKTKGKAKSKKK